MKAFVTGAAGFIGSNLCDRLLQQGYDVTGYDNLSTGNEKFLRTAFTFSNYKFIPGDLLDQNNLNNAIAGQEIVFHLAANADIKDGLQHPRKDLEQNTIATFNVLEAMRKNGIKNIVFFIYRLCIWRIKNDPYSGRCSFPMDPKQR